MDVEKWLRGLGLQQYVAAFRDNAVDPEILPELTDADLEKLGVVLGHRKRLLKAIAALAASAAAVQATTVGSAQPHGNDAERRQLTVMFCDLVGSTTLSARLDPEDMREVLGRYHRCVAETIAHFDGFVAKYMGDGVLIYFGYPQAHEDDAERAVRAGLALGQAVQALCPKGEALSVRVGVSTGLVVVGDLIGSGEAQERGVVGEAPNLAARLQALAEPKTVVIASETRRLVGELFDCEELAPMLAKGFAEPIQAWRVLRESAVESRFEAFHAGGRLTLLIGREDELHLLSQRWRKAEGGEGQVVLLAGEPGIGKSRLVVAMQDELQGVPHTRLRYFCSSHHQDSVFYPVVTQLKRAAGFKGDDADETRLQKLRVVLAPDTDPEDTALLAKLLSLPAASLPPPPALSPQRKKERLLEALLQQLEALARQSPVLMLIEDAHWIDHSSREFLDLTVERIMHLPILLLVTFRPEFEPPWIGQNVTMLTLNRLSRTDLTEMVGRITGGKALPGEVLEQIVERTDGVPLFVEELTHSLLESGLLQEQAHRFALTGALPPHAIPTTLQGSLMARLDRLAPIREVAQVGAVLGREFSYELLAAVAPFGGNELREALDRLVASELIFRIGTPQEPIYSFKHALVQEAAYASLLRERRRQLHARIATVLESQYQEVARTRPEELARHYAAAGLNTEAISYYRKSAAQAIAASANAEAIAHLKKGLELFHSLPSSLERRMGELDFQMTLGSPLIATRGWGASEVEASYGRALELCEGMGETPELFQCLCGVWVFHLVRAKLDGALELAQRLLGISGRLGGQEAPLDAHVAMGCTCYWRGDPASARVHHERALSLYDIERYRNRVMPYGQDPGVASGIHLALSLWLLGYPDQALEQIRASLAGAREVRHSFSVGFALDFGTILRHMRREPELAAESARALKELAAQHGFELFTFDSLSMEGLAQLDAGENAVEQIRRALAGRLATGNDLAQPFSLIELARRFVQVGRITDALETLQDALSRIGHTGERWWEAEAHRVMGDLFLQRSPDALDEAEDYYQRAIEQSRQQNAKSLQLRATTSLARVWRDQNKRTEARDLLAPVYAWFTEGFDTPDLREAKALLIELHK
ncbi:adenylate/guanylate cyclase domain-containing protein [Bradyrhizobium japonicum]|uniref:adenylate/guanylate cyclase domain-containing protein n=1 Tax=Bradyrhizobium japonicum TaxID=375 RepID=UPI00200F4E8F|nr:adenylate/guanylate cyclase domain-containing protein [Bradyrhizobium japonicum]UQD96026.1 AAA family ATPase [Bradyrhizobium japonicum]WLB16163.1 adenylate/guanylate cyclase domain-containing protein [Bradyrhizobium japonicum]